MENEPDEPGDTLRAKFLRLAGECSQAVVVWPPDAAMATTADEIVLLQEAFDLAPLDIVMILHESEVEQRADELFVHFPPDQSRYLDGILACQPFIVPWAAGEPFEEVVDRYVDAFL